MQTAATQAASRPRYDAVIFDLDGTLLHTLPDLVAVCNMVLEECGYPTVTTETIANNVGDGKNRLLDTLLPAGSGPEVFAAFDKRWTELMAIHGLELTTPYPGVGEMLAQLQAAGIALGIVSNKKHHLAIQTMERFFPGVFAVVQGFQPEAGIPRKPDPTGLLRAITTLGATPKTTLYVGDTEGDMRTALNAGCDSAAVTWGYGNTEGVPVSQTHTVETAAELTKLALGLV